MIVAMVVLVPVILIVLWAYFRYSPSSDEHESVVMFNTISLILALAAAGGYAFYVYITMSRGPDGQMWPYIAAVFSMALVALILGISAFVRRLIYPKGGDSSLRPPLD